jgi:hypothetical protein
MEPLMPIFRTLCDVFFLRFGSAEQISQNRGFFKRMLFITTALYAAIGMHTISLNDSVDLFGMTLTNSVAIFLFYQLIAFSATFGWAQFYATLHMAQDYKNHPEGFKPSKELTQAELSLKQDQKLMHELLRDYGVYLSDFETRQQASEINLFRMVAKNKALQQKLIHTQDSLSLNRSNDAFKNHFDTNMARLKEQCQELQSQIYRVQQNNN